MISDLIDRQQRTSLHVSSVIAQEACTTSKLKIQGWTKVVLLVRTLAAGGSTRLHTTRGSNAHREIKHASYQRIHFSQACSHACQPSGHRTTNQQGHPALKNALVESRSRTPPRRKLQTSRRWSPTKDLLEGSKRICANPSCDGVAIQDAQVDVAYARKPTTPFYRLTTH